MATEALKECCVELIVVEKMTNDLCNALPIDDLFPSMISNHVIDFKDKAEICAERTERRRVAYFLEKYLTKGLHYEQQCDTTHFYRFLTVLERSPKCDFLVKRIKRCMEQCKEELAKSTGKGQLDKSSAPSAPPLASTNAIITATTTATTIGATGGRNVTTSPANVPVDIISGDSCLVTGKDSEKCMRLMRMCVIPKIYDEWEAVAAFLDYSIETKNVIKAAHGSSRDCCTELMENWVNTDNGVKPKTWKKLIEVLSEIEELEPVIDEIKQHLMLERVSFDVFPVEDSHDYPAAYDEEETTVQGAAADMQFHHQAYPYQHGQYTEDHPTDPRWHQQHQMWRNEQYELHHHPSYDPPSAHLDQYGRPVVTNPLPPTYNRQPHAAGVDQYGTPMVGNQVPPTDHRSPQPDFSAFILYSKEENDPEGDQVRCLSDLLHNCGINCDIDLYHMNENIPDWSFWVGKSLEYHIASQYSYVILVCSPIMISTLEERNDNARLQMVAGYIDRLTLRYYLQQGAHRVLPLFINNPAVDYVPPSLSNKTRYYFPYDKLNELPENVSTQAVLNHPDFASLRSLVATLTEQQEIPPPGLGPVPSVRNQPYMTTGAGTATVRTRAQRPPTGNSPKILRRDPDLPPSTIDQDAPYDNTTRSLRPVAPQTVTLRTGEQQAQYDMSYGGRGAVHQPPLTGADVYTRQPTGVFEPQEEIGVKWPRDEPSSDNDSCYSTPSESPRDNSLGTLHSSHFPIEATPTLQHNDSMNSEMDQVTTCTEQDDDYHNALSRQNK